jgi:DNA (cytosine-5)-methyltransferase 1
VSKDRLALVTVNSVEYVIVDIGMRMLVPRELYRAQGFPDIYRIDIEYRGKPLTKTAQVRMVGNSVSPSSPLRFSARYSDPRVSRSRSQRDPSRSVPLVRR